MDHDRDKVLAVARQLLPAWPARAGCRIEYLPGGYSNRNYRLDIGGTRYALRIVDGAKPRARERQYLAIAGAPDVVGYDPLTGHMLTRWIDGEILAASPPSPAEGGRYLAELHAEIPSGIRRYDYQAEIETLLADAVRPDPDVVSRFRELAWSASEHRGCHNDLNPWNVIRGSRNAEAGRTRFRTLDWEFAGDNDRLFDLVGLGHGLQWTPTQLAACAAAYAATPPGQTRPLHATPMRLEDTVCAYRIREYAWAAAQIGAGNDRPEIVEQAMAMRRAIVYPR
ncbi:MAG: phosphotransferase [Gammaproteobacteria bacterium]|nr:phosphotransferase [Gammaproteobacteria bacterium]